MNHTSLPPCKDANRKRAFYMGVNRFRKNYKTHAAAWVGAIVLLSCSAADRVSAATPASPLTAEQSAEDAATQVLIKGGAGLNQFNQGGKIEAKEVKLTFKDTVTLIEVAPNTKGIIEIKPLEKVFDASGFTRIVFDLTNLGEEQLHYHLELENDFASEQDRSMYFSGRLNPGQTKGANVYLTRKKEAKKKYPELEQFEKMRGVPGGITFSNRAVNPASLQLIRITILPSPKAVKFTLGNIYAAQPPVPALLKYKPEAFFPFIDKYGQYIHGTWPGKVTKDEDLKEATALEEKDLAAHPGANDRSQYGGWTKGPKLEATGFFRVTKYQDKWWFVDPEGYLFWSSGPTCCGFGGADTLYAGRERYFADMPAPDEGPLSSYFKQGTIYSYSKANYIRKFGENWAPIHNDLTHRRLKSWGMNTLGNWSNPTIIYNNNYHTPYVRDIDFKTDEVTPRKMPDPFNPEFRTKLREALLTRSESFQDPWCIGYFIHNELKFTSGVHFMPDLIAEAPTKYAKQALVEFLKKKYTTIAQFNDAIGAQFESWDAVKANRKTVKFDKIADVATEFNRLYNETYFRTCRDELKSVAPNHLYLGCRFLQVVSKEPLPVAAEFCDVVSFNIYEFDVSTRSVAGLDKPFIVGEFHFGALDRGMFATGNRWGGDQQDRAGAYEDYVESALNNPYCIGAHWFQYNSQAFTGRPADGENFQIGLLDIAGNPYPELRDAIRKVSYSMYQIRAKARD